MRRWPAQVSGAGYGLQDLTYREHGATRGSLLTGYHHVDRHTLLGLGRPAFEQATDTLCHWDMHRRAGLTVIASSPSARPGSVVDLSLGWPWLARHAPCLVVYTVEDPNRRGFAYGTLRGHPESGEESFLIEHTPNGEVWLSIRAFSRPAGLLPFLGGPLTRKIQKLVTERYIAALQGDR